MSITRMWLDRSRTWSLPTRRILFGIFAAFLAAGLCVAVPGRGIAARGATGTTGSIERLSLEADEIFPRRTCVVRMVDGKPEGEARYFATNGDLCMIEHYTAGVLDGERLMFYPNGSDFGRLNYVKGTPVGEQWAWYPDGKPLQVMAWHEGAIHGPFRQYYPNGSPKIFATMVLGRAQGERQHFLSDGRLFGITQWVDGQQVDQRILIQPTQRDVAILRESESWVGLHLADVWADR